MRITSGYWKGLEVAILGAHRNRLRSRGHNNYATYVQCTPGEVGNEIFSVGITRPRRSTFAIRVAIQADGHPLTEEILSGSDVGTRIEGYNKVLDDDHKWKKFMFGIKDEHTPILLAPSGDEDELGTFKVIVEAGTATPMGETAVVGSVEPSFKGNRELGLHTFIAGEIGGPGVAFNLHKFDADPFAPTLVLEFRYRTLPALQDLNIVPRPQLPDVIVISDSDDDERAPLRKKTVTRTTLPTPRSTPPKKRKFIEEVEEDDDGTRRVMSRRELQG